MVTERHNRDSFGRFSKGNEKVEFSDIHKVRISNSIKGKKCPWNSESGKKLGMSRKGVKQSEEHVKKRVLSRIANGHYKHSEETNKKISVSHKGVLWPESRKESFRRALHVENIKEKRRLARSKQVLPVKDTKIERKVQDYLSKSNIEFVTHKPFKVDDSYRHQVDIYIPSVSLAIECDGEYWHSSLEAVRRDAIINEGLFNQGVSLLRLREDEIINGEYESRMRGELNIGC